MKLSLITAAFLFALNAYSETIEIQEKHLTCDLENAWGIEFDLVKRELKLAHGFELDRVIIFKDVQIIPKNSKSFIVLTSAGKPLVTVDQDGMGSNGASDHEYPYSMQMETIINGETHLAPAGCYSDLIPRSKEETEN